MKINNAATVLVNGRDFPYLQTVRDRFEPKPDFFQDKVVIVTGASSGIGQAIARDLAEKKASVVLASRNEKILNESQVQQG